ncbi:non-ribosomal peptide synthetase [Streptomyces hirsutus]
MLDTTALDQGPRASYDDEALSEWFFHEFALDADKPARSRPAHP